MVRQRDDILGCGESESTGEDGLVFRQKFVGDRVECEALGRLATGRGSAMCRANSLTGTG